MNDVFMSCVCVHLHTHNYSDCVIFKFVKRQKRNCKFLENEFSGGVVARLREKNRAVLLLRFVKVYTTRNIFTSTKE